jgi:uncharacterized ion transporter superfamily protein YfcC
LIDRAAIESLIVIVIVIVMTFDRIGGSETTSTTALIGVATALGNRIATSIGSTAIA